MVGRRLLLFAVISLLAGCHRRSASVMETRLPAGAPAGENEQLMYAMCTGRGTENGAPADLLKVTYYKPGGATASTRTYKCSEVRKNYKPAPGSKPGTPS